MSTGLYGADPEELRQFARELEHANTVLLAVKSQLSARISSNLRWEGPDAFVFRHAWQSSYAPVLGQAAAIAGSHGAHPASPGSRAGIGEQLVPARRPIKLLAQFSGDLVSVGPPARRACLTFRPSLPGVILSGCRPAPARTMPATTVHMQSQPEARPVAAHPLWSGRRPRKVASIDGLEAFERFRMQPLVPAHFVSDVHRPQNCCCAHSHQQFVPDGARPTLRGAPVLQRRTAGFEDLKMALLSPGCWEPAGLDQAGRLHLAQLLVNLLMRGLPKKSQRFVEAPRQFSPGARLFQQRRQNGVWQRH